MLWADFIGGAYQARSASLAADRAVNLFVDTREIPGSPKQKFFYGTPGLKLESTVTTTACRGWYSQDDLTLVVVGAMLYKRTATGYTALGAIANDGRRVTYASNGQGGNQVGIVGGGELKVYDTFTAVLSDPIALPFVWPVMIAFIDGYALINQKDSPNVWFSALEDMTSWDAIDFFTRSNTSDNIIGIAVTRSRVWAFGSKTLTLFYDSGDTDTPFVPYPGTTAQIGLINPAAIVMYNDTLTWLGQSDLGGPMLVRATSDPSQIQQISTAPIDRFLARCTTLATAECDMYEQESHPFVIVTCPDAVDDLRTYAFDLKEGVWHARASVDAVSGGYLRWRVRGVTVVGATVLGGDATTGDLYQLDLDTYTEKGSILKRERTAPYVSAENQWLFCEQFELGVQAGVGLNDGQGALAQISLEVSRDAAQTWVSAGFATAGKIGEYFARAIWRRLGSARADRLVFRVTQTDPVKTAWGPGAWLTVTPGTGQL